MTATTILDKADGLGVATSRMMKALVYRGPGKKALEDHVRPELAAATDAIVKITKTTICGTDLHILKGDLPTTDTTADASIVTTMARHRACHVAVAEHDGGDDVCEYLDTDGWIGAF
jgi:threonine dehydrogenase-like Zn-dependent dehydrogenase